MQAVNMNEAERIAKLRTELGSLLDTTCSHIGHVSRAVKRLDNLKIVLYMKRDKAKTAIQECIRNLQKQLTELHKVAEMELAAEIHRREELLRSTKVKLMQHIKDTASECTIVEELLEIDNEDILAIKGQHELEKMNLLMEENPDKAVVGLTHLEFVPNTSNIMVAFNDPGLFGYLQCTAVNPSDITVKIGDDEEEGLPKRILLGKEETVVIYTDGPHIENLIQYMQVSMLKPDTNICELDIVDRRDGSYTFQICPDMVGPHTINIKLYGSSIASSPIPILAWEKPQTQTKPRVPKIENDVKNRKDADGKKVRVCRNFLTAVSRHIESNPPVKEPMFVPVTGGYTTNNYSAVPPATSKGKAAYPKRSFHDEVDSELVPGEMAAGDFNKDFLQNSSSEKLECSQVRKDSSVNDHVASKKELGQGDAGHQRRPWSSYGRPSQDTVCRADLSNNWRNPQNKWNNESKQNKAESANSTLKQNLSSNEKVNSDVCNEMARTSAKEKSSNFMRGDSWESELSETSTSNEVNTLKQKQDLDKTATPQTVSPVTLVVPQNTPNDGVVADPLSKYAFDPDSVVKQVSQNLLNCKDFGEESSYPLGSGSGTTEVTFTKQQTPKDNSDSSTAYLSEKEFISKPTTEPKRLKNYRPPEPEAQKVQNDKPTTASSSIKFKPQGGSGSIVTLHSGTKEEVWDLDDNNNSVSIKVSKASSIKPPHNELAHEKDKVPITKQNSSKKSDVRVSFDISEETTDRTFQGGPPPKKNSIAEQRSTNIIAKYLEKDPVLKMNILHKFGKKGMGKGDTFSFPIGVTVNRKKDIIVCDSGNAMVKVFQWDGSHKYTLGKHDEHTFVRPSAVVTNNRDDFFVKDDKQIQAFGTEGKLLRAFGLGILHRPFGLALNKEDYLVTVDQNRRDPKVVFFSQSGEVMRDCTFQPILRDMRSRCRFLTVYGDRLFVVDLGKSEVYITDFNGKLIKSFGSFGDNPGQFREPSGITVDSHGNLLIADSKNNRIQLFSLSGECKGVVRLNQDITRPSDIHLTEDGHLLVVNFLLHCIKIYSPS